MFRPASRHVTIRLARHTSRGSDFARYASIHAFFSRQVSSPLIAPSAPPLKHRYEWKTYQSGLGFSYRRSFSFSTVRRVDKPGGKDDVDPKVSQPSKPASTNPPLTPPDPPPPASPPGPLPNYPEFIQRLIQNAPHLHRPTRDELLGLATGFWERLRIRWKWFTIRSFRKFNADDISAFVTLIIFSQTVWILVGTTTFFSVVFATINSLRLQEYVARAVSDYLTAATGVTVVFESAIVPKWKDSRISFKNVYVSRRPADHTPKQKRPRDPHAAHKAAVGYDVSSHPAYHGVGEDDHEPDDVTEEEDNNYTMFDLNVDSIDVTLSLWRWLDGKGLVQDAVIKGVRGVFDRSHVHWDPSKPWDPAEYRRSPAQGDFDLEMLTIEDLLVTVHQPGDFRPFPVSIFRMDLPAFRKQWLFWDLLHAETIVGQFDGCLFSLHKPQSMGRTNDRDLRDSQWERISRFRIDGVNVDHIQAQTTQGGPISWITSGKLDAVLDIKFPREETEDALDALLGDIADAITPRALVDLIPGQRELAKPPLVAPENEATNEDEGPDKRVVVDIDLRFKDLKAAVPMFTSDLSYVSNALIRPIVAFMNAHHTLVPIRCRAIKHVSDFEGSWTLWETGLSDEIALQIYEAMAYHVLQVNFRRRIQTVSFWSLQQTAGAVLGTLRLMADPMRAHMRAMYSTLDDAISLENLGTYISLKSS